MGCARLRNAVKALQTATAHFHSAVMGPSLARAHDVKPPTPDFYENVPVCLFTLDNDMSFRTVKIASQTVPGTVYAHAHWTKSQTDDQSGKNVCWRLFYSTYNGEDEAIAANGYVDLSGTYLNNGTTTRYIYETNDAKIVVDPADYISFKCMAVTCSNAIDEPAAVSVDLVWDEYINVDASHHTHV